MTKTFTIPDIETGRLLLRAHRPDDFEDIVVLRQDPVSVRNTGGKLLTPSECWGRMQMAVGSWALRGFGYWVIEDKQSGRFVGEAGLGDFKRGLSPSIDGIPEAGWSIAPDFRRQGMASEAVDAVLNWADENLAAALQACIIVPDNEPSIRIAGKLGFEFAQVAILPGDKVNLYFRNKKKK